MFYVEQYQRYRQGSLKYEQTLRNSTTQHWSLCSQEYETKCPQLNPPPSPSNVLFLTQLASIDKVSERHLCFTNKTWSMLSNKQKSWQKKCVDRFHSFSHPHERDKNLFSSNRWKKVPSNDKTLHRYVSRKIERMTDLNWTSSLLRFSGSPTSMRSTRFLPSAIVAPAN